MRAAGVRRLLRFVPPCVFAFVAPLSAQTPSPSPSLVRLTVTVQKPSFLSSEIPTGRFRITNLSQDVVVILTLGGMPGFGDDFPVDPGKWRIGRTGGGPMGTVRLTPGQSYEGDIGLRGCTPVSDPCTTWERFTLPGMTEGGKPYLADSGKVGIVVAPDPNRTFDGVPTGNRVSFPTTLDAQSTLAAHTMHVLLKLPDSDTSGKVIGGLHALAERIFASRGAVVTQWGVGSSGSQSMWFLEFEAASPDRVGVTGAAVDALVRASRGRLSEVSGDRWFTPRDCNDQIYSVRGLAVSQAREAIAPLSGMLGAELQSYGEDLRSETFSVTTNDPSGLAVTWPLPLDFCSAGTSAHGLSGPSDLDVRFAGSAVFFSVGAPTQFRVKLPELRPGDERYVGFDLLQYDGAPMTIVDDRPEIVVFASVRRAAPLRRGVYPEALATTAAVRRADTFAHTLANEVNLPSFFVTLREPATGPDITTVGAAFTLRYPTDVLGSKRSPPQGPSLLHGETKGH